MKVLHINSYYSDSSFYKNLYDTQIINGLEIDVFVPISTSLDISTKKFGNYTTISKNYSSFDRILFYRKHIKIYKDIKVKYDIKQYSITHAHSLFSNGYISLQLKKEYGIPYVVAVRNTDVNIFFKKIIHLRKLGIQILNEAEKVIFISEPYRNLVLTKYIPLKNQLDIYNKSIVIPNGIDDFWFDNLRVPAPLNKTNQLNLLYVGGIDQNKNITTVIKAIDLLRQKDYEIIYTVVGPIKDVSIYDSIIKNSFVKYIKPQNKEELIKIYRCNDIFIMPSITETFGLVYAEAMSQGLPVIYSRGQGFDEQFPDGIIGYSVNSFDIKELAMKIEEVIKNYNSLSKNCIEVKKFKWEKIESIYKKSYKEILKLET